VVAAHLQGGLYGTASNAGALYLFRIRAELVYRAYASQELMNESDIHPVSKLPRATFRFRLIMDLSSASWG
tara:strand:- start:382 stop:594 length:213 start_codon:yes stop_codon:yes gene_type:complete